MERNISIEGIVLTNRRWGELHRKITLLSPELGVFDAVAYGARKGKLAGGIEPCTIGTFYLYHNRARSEYSLKDVQPIGSTGSLREDIVRLYIAHAMVEMALRMHGGDYGVLYRIMGSFLVLLQEQSIDPRLVLIQFIWKFIGIMGLQPDLRSCPICFTSYDESEILSFNTGLHTACCAQCGDVDTEGFELAMGPGARRYLLLTKGLEESDSVSIELSETATLRMIRYLMRYVTNILGQPLSSLSGGVLMEALHAN